MGVKIEQDQEKCVGCGTCVQVCPDNWEMIETDDGPKSKPKKTELDDVGCNQDAADSCPVHGTAYVLCAS